MSRIELTEDQLSQVGNIKQKWLDILYSNEPTNEQVVINWINKAYSKLGYKHPQVIFFDTPYKMKQAARELTGENDIDYSSKSLVDDVGDTAFYDYFLQIGTLSDLETNGKLNQRYIMEFIEYSEFMRAKPFMTIYLDEVALVCRAPQKIHHDTDWLLHSEFGQPTIVWQDGTKDWFWHGKKRKNFRSAI